MVPIHTIGQRYVDINATSNRAEEREEPDDSPVTSGPDTPRSWFYWRAKIRTDFCPTVSELQM
jgi:hypothetical protein